eukprot:GHVQ01025322.1.p1 GENE.GHVQ01025322.1~~GHVQ01025322.1.p1  ORF type:complete len:844 (+),score=132.33 GHVQ01025322.1:449-2980(+)
MTTVAESSCSVSSFYPFIIFLIVNSILSTIQCTWAFHLFGHSTINVCTECVPITSPVVDHSGSSVPHRLPLSYVSCTFAPNASCVRQLVPSIGGINRNIFLHFLPHCAHLSRTSLHENFHTPLSPHIAPSFLEGKLRGRLPVRVCPKDTEEGGVEHWRRAGRGGQVAVFAGWEVDSCEVWRGGDGLKRVGPCKAMRESDVGSSAASFLCEWGGRIKKPVGLVWGWRGRHGGVGRREGSSGGCQVGQTRGFWMGKGGVGVEWGRGHDGGWKAISSNTAPAPTALPLIPDDTTIFEDLSMPPIYPESSRISYSFATVQDLKDAYKRKLDSVRHSPVDRLKLEDKWLAFARLGMEAQLKRYMRVYTWRGRLRIWLARLFSFGTGGVGASRKAAKRREQMGRSFPVGRILTGRREDVEKESLRGKVEKFKEYMEREEAIEETETGGKLPNNLRMWRTSDEPISEFSDEYLNTLDPIEDRRVIAHYQCLRQLRKEGRGAPDLEASGISLADMMWDFYSRHKHLIERPRASVLSTSPYGTVTEVRRHGGRGGKGRGVGASEEEEEMFGREEGGVGREFYRDGIGGYRVPEQLGGDVVKRPLFVSYQQDEDEDDKPVRPKGRPGGGGAEFLRNTQVEGGMVQMPNKERTLGVSAYFAPLVLVGGFLPRFAASTIGLSALCAAAMVSRRGAPQRTSKLGRRGESRPPNIKTVVTTVGLLAAHIGLGALKAALILRSLKLPPFLLPEGVMAMCVNSQMWLASLLYKTFIDEYGKFDAIAGYGESVISVGDDDTSDDEKRRPPGDDWEASASSSSDFSSGPSSAEETSEEEQFDPDQQPKDDHGGDRPKPPPI